ncbi:uncharacterized protein [Clinocottus analis]|uniref:uncharacterized protein isoform X5 n=1 Tax=Clinocottus analis TaxID=304258 RepID=UPI0035C1429B
MTSLTCTIRMFVFMFLNAIDLSKAGCLDYLRPMDWKENVTYTLSLVRAEDLEGTVKCTLEHEWKGTRKSGGNLYVYCFKDKYPSAQCQGESSEKIHFIHLMCLAAKVYNASSDDTAGVCEYGTVCKMFSEAASPHKQPDTGNTTGNLKYFLILSLLFNLILPSAVFLYMRRQRAQDHTLRTEIQLQSCTLLSATDNDSETNLLREKPEEKTIL